jgi:hypothetical protein
MIKNHEEKRNFVQGLDAHVLGQSLVWEEAGLESRWASDACRNLLGLSSSKREIVRGTEAVDV